MTVDEDEVVEVMSFTGEIGSIRLGVQMAKARARSDYIAGRITVEEFESEIGRLLLKEQEG